MSKIITNREFLLIFDKEFWTSREREREIFDLNTPQIVKHKNCCRKKLEFCNRLRSLSLQLCWIWLIILIIELLLAEVVKYGVILKLKSKNLPFHKGVYGYLCMKIDR